MKIHEHQAKQILREFNIPVPKGQECFAIDEAVNAAEDIGGKIWVVKAQIHAGGRGKGGGVKVANSISEVKEFASQILGMQLITHQTSADGQKVRRLLVEEGVEIEKEYYLGLVVDRASQKVCVMASSEGGMEIEKVAEETPEKIHKVLVNPEGGLSHEDSLMLAENIGIPRLALESAANVLQQLYKCYWETDATLVEINPLVLTKDDKIIALDAKMNFDDNALSRQSMVNSMRDFSEEDEAEIEASKHDLSYISLEGNIGCMVNGAGLAMATMDTIKLFGAEPANFLDVGGGATAEKVTEAFKLMLQNPRLKAILVNIFGGIMQCDVIAEGVVTAARQVELDVPLVVRMKGTNEEVGKQILANSGLPIISANNMSDAAQKVVDAIKGAA